MPLDARLSQLLRRPDARQVPPPPPQAHLDAIGTLPDGIAPRLGQPGAQLHDVLAYLQQRVPAATGLVVRDGVLYVAYAEPPDNATREAARAALTDPPALARLADRPKLAAAASAIATSDLRAALLDATLSDAAWLQAFRKYQVALLSAESQKAGG